MAVDSVPGVQVVKGAIWLSDANNQAKVGAAYAKAKAWEAGLSDYERNTYEGRAVFELASLLVPEKVAAATKAVKLVKVERAAEGAAEDLRLLVEVKTGARAAEQAAEAPRRWRSCGPACGTALAKGRLLNVINPILSAETVFAWACALTR